VLMLVIWMVTSLCQKLPRNSKQARERPPVLQGGFHGVSKDKDSLQTQRVMVVAIKVLVVLGITQMDHGKEQMEHILHQMALN